MIRQAEEHAAEIEDRMGLIDRKISVVDQNTVRVTEQLDDLSRTSEVSDQPPSLCKMMLGIFFVCLLTW